jgi:hypothetical protein
MHRRVRAYARIAPALLLASLATGAPGCVWYRPKPLDEIPFRDRIQYVGDQDVRVGVAALSSKEARDAFGVPLKKKGVQPVWLEIENRSDGPMVFIQQSVDPDYFAPAEAARRSHFSGTRRFLFFGVAGILFPPLWVAAPVELVSARLANRRMDERFDEAAIGNRVVAPEKAVEGFVFTSFDEGTKAVPVGLVTPAGRKRFKAFVQVPGLRVDHARVDFATLYPPQVIRDVDWSELRGELARLPCCTTNEAGTRTGDPLNLVLVGDFEDVLRQLTRAGWDETESLTAKTAWQTGVAFLFRSQYRYAPVSNLYAFGRAQDFAMQNARATIDERNHLRLWAAPLRVAGTPVFVGQISRDIGVRFTLKTWNLTTHLIDPDLDDSRENVVGDLIETDHVSRLGYAPGAGERTRDAPGRNLTGDPFWTDGLRAVVGVAADPTPLEFLDWVVD